MQLKVTQEMLMSGRQDDPNYCPIALAAKAIGFIEVTVGHREMYGTYNNQRVKAELPESAMSLIQTFDETGKGEELEFEIELIILPS